MANLIKLNALTFDDILLIPQYSDIASRKDVDISTSMLGKKFAMPICSANMDTITEVAMAEEMHKLGGVGLLHRYASIDAVSNWIQQLRMKDVQAIPSIGIKAEDLEAGLEWHRQGALGINIDIAHGDSEHMVKMVSALAKAGVKVIAGNVATYHAARRLADAGAEVIKVGIGPGSMCTTRIVTGHGVPQLTAIEDCAAVKRLAPNVKIIADGGIRNAGDCVKALAFGADMIMIGSLLAGTKETPGQVVELQTPDFKYYRAKEYRGMASYSARSSVSKVDSSYTPEGEHTYVKCKGPAADVINQLVGGIRSGFSYSGAHNLQELQEKAQYVVMTNSGMAESKPHGVTH